MGPSPFAGALVTGASSGIGASMVRRLASAGVATLAVGRRAERLDALVAEFDVIEAVPADLNDPDDLERVAALIGDRGIDLVVNNAGFGTSGDFHLLDAERLNREIGLNVAALTRLSHAALESMAPRRRGYLLNVSSVVGFQPAPKLAVYAATKAYVTSLTESLHAEADRHGVHVTALCPGLTRTEFASVSNTEGYDSQYPEFMWMTADEVAEAGLAAVARNKVLAVPGPVNKTVVTGSGLLPRPLRRLLANLVQR